MNLMLSDLTVSRSGVLVFEHLHFTMRAGECWAVVGDPGAFLHIIAGRGYVVSGERILQLPETTLVNPSIADTSKYVSYVPAHYHFRNLSNTTTFYYQQRFNLSDDGSDTTAHFLKDAMKVSHPGNWTSDSVVTRLKLDSVLGKQLIMLSNGETRRVMIAASLLQNPVLLLLDHPLSGLDMETRRDFSGFVSEIAASGISVIMATSPHEIPEAITHVAVFKNRQLTFTCQRKDFDPSKFDFGINDLVQSPQLDELLGHQQENQFDLVVQMTDVNIRYGDATILDCVNWEVRQGERWALTGHNGAGKSTLLSLINGDNPQAYANQIILFDQRKGHGESMWSIKKKIGFVSPELFRYFPSGYSCIDVIESGLYDTIGLSRANDPLKADLIRKWMEALGIGHAFDKTLDKVSVSTQRLCLLARALIKNPPLLILDEPCEGLDLQQQQHFKDLVDLLCSKTNVTLIYVSHYRDQIPLHVTKNLELRNGKVVSNSDLDH